MYTDIPANMPTHLLSDPQRWITRSGAWFRKLSIDELPQILRIFTGKMSVIGLRPALWNQDDLIEERDKYGANDVRPGLTGWAQIRGREQVVPIQEKFLIAVPEAAKYFGIGAKQMRHLAENHLSDFAIFMGNR